MKNTIKVLVGFLWLAAIGYFFFGENHPYYINSLGFLGRSIPTILVFGAIVAGFIGAEAWWNHSKQKPLLTFRVSVWKTVLAILILSAGLISVSHISADLAIYNGGTIFQDEEGWGMLPEGVPLEEGMVEQISDGTLLNSASSFMSIFPEELQANFTKVNHIRASVFLWSKIIIGLFFLALLTLVTYSIGHRILRLTSIGKKWKDNPKNLAEFLLSLAIGLGVCIALMFLTGLFNIAYLGVVAGIAVVLIAVSHKDAWGLLKTSTKSMEVEANPEKLAFWIMLAGILVFIYNLLGIIRPMPVGWDDSNYYLYIPERIAALRSLLDGAGGMYNWELVATIGSYTNDAMLGLFTNFWGGLLAILGAYLLLSYLMSKKSAAMLSTTFYILPSVVFQSSTDLKNDLPLLFFAVLALYAFSRFFKDEENGWLYLSAILIGLAIGVKVTAGITLLVLLAFLGYKFFKKRGAITFLCIPLGLLIVGLGGSNLFGIPFEVVRIAGVATLLVGFISFVMIFKDIINIKKLKPVLIFCAIILAMVSPWIVKNNLIDGLPLKPETYLASAPNIAEIDYGDLQQGCAIEQLGDEFAGYISGRGDKEADITPLSLLKMPWQMTMNPGFTGVYVDIGFIFLGLLPLFLWYLIEKKHSVFNKAALASVYYFAILIFFFNGVIWYGFAGVIMLFAMVGMMLDKYEKDDWAEERILSLIIKTSLAVTAIFVVLVKIAGFGSLNSLGYLGGLITGEEYIKSINPGVLETAEVIKADPDAVGKHVYKIGGATAYFLADIEDVDFFYDESMDDYECLRQNMTYEEIAATYYDLDLAYVAFDYTNLLDEKKDATLRERYSDFYYFGTTYLEVAVAVEDYILFKVPEPTS